MLHSGIQSRQMSCAVLTLQHVLVVGELLALTVHVPADLDGDSYYLRDRATNKLMELKFQSKPDFLITGLSLLCFE